MWADTRTFARAIALVSRAAQGAAFVFFAGMLLLSIAPVVQVWLAKLVVDHVVGGTPRGEIMTLGLLYAITIVVPTAAQPFHQVLSARLADAATAEVDQQLMRAGAAMADLARIEQPAYHDELRLLQQMPVFLPRLFPALRSSIGVLVTLAGLMALLFGLHPLIPLLLVCASAPHLLMERRTQQLMYTAMVEHSRAAREMDYCLRLATEAGPAKEWRAFGLGGYFLDRFRTRRRVAVADMARARMRHFRASFGFAAVYASVLAGGFGYVAHAAFLGRLTAGDVALYLNAVIQSQALVAQLPMALGLLFEIRLRVGRYFEFIDRAAPAIVVPPAGTGRVLAADARAGLEFRHVRFSYPGTTTPVLEDLSALLPNGKLIALVGGNGAGKSTIVKLLTRMYDPCNGTLSLDGSSLAAYDLHSLRSGISVVYQDFARFSLTLHDNVGVAAEASRDGDERVQQAMRWAELDKLAARLPLGYRTQLTTRFEGGVDLSGGEWQKVALARAFVRDPMLLIFDEPTNALDAESEHTLMERLRLLAAGRTSLLISHRLSAARMADHVIVLEGGRITEEGTHSDLMRAGGQYAELFAMQAERFV